MNALQGRREKTAYRLPPSALRREGRRQRAVCRSYSGRKTEGGRRKTPVSSSVIPAALAGFRTRLALAAAAGALLALAFEPLAWWPLAFVCSALLIWLWQDASPRHAAWLGFAFNAGTFATGTYWLYISIHIFGQAPVWLAFAIMAALVIAMGAYHAALGYAVARWLP